MRLVLLALVALAVLAAVAGVATVVLGLGRRGPTGSTPDDFAPPPDEPAPPPTVAPPPPTGDPRDRPPTVGPPPAATGSAAPGAPAPPGWRSPAPPPPAQPTEPPPPPAQPTEPGARVGGDPRGAPTVAEQPRFANVRLTHHDGTPVDRLQPLPQGAVVALDVDIGWLDPRSAVAAPTPFPDRLVPGDTWLRVLVCSADFDVALEPRALDAGAHAAEQPLFLPAHGPTDTVTFALRAPDRPGPARATIAYYHRDAVVQAQELLAAVGGPAGSVTVVTTYTASERLDDLDRIPDVARLSILAGPAAPGPAQLVVRPPAPPARAPAPTSTERPVMAVTVGVPQDPVRATVADLRRALAEGMEDADRDLRRHGRLAHGRRARDRLIADLRRLAPIGRALYRQVLAEAGSAAMADLHRPAPRPVVQIARPEGSRFSPPWNYAYDIPLDRAVPVDELPVCPLVAEWDGESPLVAAPSPDCPHRDEHRPGTLCPYGFWGVGQTIEVPPSARDTAYVIPLRPGAALATGETRDGVDVEELGRHIERIGAAFARRSPVDVRRGDSVARIRDLIEPDQPVLYFYCHGHKERHDSPDTWLGVGRGEYITADDVSDWITAGLPHRVVWDAVRPLVVINACHSLDIVPETFLSYVDTFVRSGRALGVIGTEVKVPQALAMRWAEAFFAAFAAEGRPVGGARRAATFDFLAEGSLFGLAYTAHAWSHLALASQPTASP